jgi:2-oxoglutarate ferredoxin oxidoreductase subunit gamma
VVISDVEIDHPEVLSADVVVALSQEAYKKFAKTIHAGGLLIVDEDRVAAHTDFSGVKVPVARIAQETTGKAITANTVALGVLVGMMGVVSRDSLEKAVLARAPKGTEEMNRKALQAGFAAAEELKKTA